MNNSYSSVFETLLDSTWVQEAVKKYGDAKIASFYARAWDKGHADGFDSIKSEFMDIIEIADIATR